MSNAFEIYNCAVLHEFALKARSIPYYSMFSVQKWSIITQFHIGFLLSVQNKIHPISPDTFNGWNEKSIFVQVCIQFYIFTSFFGQKIHIILWLENRSFLYHLYLSLNLKALINMRTFYLERKIANPCEPIQYHFTCRNFGQRRSRYAQKAATLRGTTQNSFHTKSNSDMEWISHCAKSYKFMSNFFHILYS